MIALAGAETDERIVLSVKDVMTPAGEIMEFYDAGGVMYRLRYADMLQRLACYDRV